MCTKKQISAEEYERARRLYELGAAVDEDELERMRVESAGLSIFQNSDLPSIVQDLPAGKTGCSFNMVIINDSARDMLAPISIRFEGPEWLYGLRLIPDPWRIKGSKYRDVYFLHPDECSYARETVLNHRIGQKQRLAPDDCADGFLLAIADYRMPFNYNDWDTVKVRVKLQDQHGNRASSVFRLRVQRGPEHKRITEAIRSPRTRRRLFPPEDSVGTPEPQGQTDAHDEASIVQK